jgi:hypothetical protein
MLGVPTTVTVKLFLGAFAKLQQLLLSSCLSAHRHETAPFPLDGFSRHFTFKHFLKIFLDGSIFVKIGRE